jgi:hypothetical protein
MKVPVLRALLFILVIFASLFVNGKMVGEESSEIAG